MIGSVSNCPSWDSARKVTPATTLPRTQARSRRYPTERLRGRPQNPPTPSKIRSHMRAISVVIPKSTTPAESQEVQTHTTTASRRSLACCESAFDPSRDYRITLEPLPLGVQTLASAQDSPVTRSRLSDRLPERREPMSFEKPSPSGPIRRPAAYGRPRAWSDSSEALQARRCLDH